LSKIGYAALNPRRRSTPVGDTNPRDINVRRLYALPRRWGWQEPRHQALSGPLNAQWASWQAPPLNKSLTEILQGPRDQGFLVLRKNRGQSTTSSHGDCARWLAKLDIRHRRKLFLAGA